MNCRCGSCMWRVWLRTVWLFPDSMRLNFVFSFPVRVVYFSLTVA